MDRKEATVHRQWYLRMDHMPSERGHRRRAAPRKGGWISSPARACVQGLSLPDTGLESVKVRSEAPTTCSPWDNAALVCGRRSGGVVRTVVFAAAANISARGAGGRHGRCGRLCLFRGGGEWKRCTWRTCLLDRGVRRVKYIGGDSCTRRHRGARSCRTGEASCTYPRSSEGGSRRPLQ